MDSRLDALDVLVDRLDALQNVRRTRLLLCVVFFAKMLERFFIDLEFKRECGKTIESSPSFL